jgi:hypothetical protein
MAIVLGAALSVSACAATEEADSGDEPTASDTSEALSTYNAKWCITHTFGLRYLSHDTWTGSQWHYEVDNYYGAPQGNAAAWSNGICPHGIGVSAKAYGHLYASRCCAY